MKYTIIIWLFLHSTALADDSTVRSIGMKIGYRKYTYKTYKIAYENKSFLFSKRQEDNYMINGYAKLRIGNQLILIPSLDLWENRYNNNIVINIDLAYSPFKSQKIHKYVGFGIGFHHVSKPESWKENKERININIFIGGNLELSNNIVVSTELRFFPWIFHRDLDLSPIVFLAGVSYDLRKIEYDSIENKAAKYTCYSIFGVGILSRLLVLILQSGLPYS